MGRIAIVIAAAALSVGGVPVADAGGGGCHRDESTQATGTQVGLSELCFNPTIIHIRPGQTVTWHNKDDVIHTVTGMPGTFDSDDLSLGQTFAHTFTEPGAYAYYCVLHRRMAGAVVVDGDITKAGLVSGSTGTGGGGGTSSTPEGAKASASSAVLPITALLIAIPVAAGLGFGAGRRRMSASPS
jgi:plastocyanin